MQKWFGTLFASILLAKGDKFLPIPEQVHIALADDPSSMTVQVSIKF
jgi:hypothetical protein